MKYKTLLVPTDFSKNSTVALRYAVHLASDIKAKLVVMHAFRLLETSPSTNTSALSIRKQRHLDTLQQFEKLEEEEFKGQVVSYEFLSEIGFATNAIQEVAGSQQASLVIMGAGESGRMGSTADHILRNSDRATFLVPQGTSYTPIRRISVILDHASDLHALSKMIKDLGMQSAKFSILDVSGSHQQSIGALGVDAVFESIETEHIAFAIDTFSPNLVIDCSTKVSGSLLQSMLELNVVYGRVPS